MSPVKRQIVVPAETHVFYECAAGHGHVIKPMPCAGGYGPPSKTRLQGPCDLSGGMYRQWHSCPLIQDIAETVVFPEKLKTEYQCSACKKWVGHVYPKVTLPFGMVEHCKSSGALCIDCHHLWLDVNILAHAMSTTGIRPTA